MRLKWILVMILMLVSCEKYPERECICDCPAADETCNCPC
jgi:hypothetical protein